MGACSAAVSADSGHEVLVYDINQELVNSLSSKDKDKIEAYLFEKGLGDLIIRNQARIKFTFHLPEAEKFVEAAEAVFMCLPTPERDGTGETNLEIYEAAAKTLAQILVKRNNGEQSRYVLIINKSTVPIEMVSRTKEIMEELGVKNFGTGSNPEFLVEGKAIEGSIRPERIVVGAWNEKDFAVFRNIYDRFIEAPNVNYLEVNPLEAAASKLLANYMLFNRLANCFDVVGRVCEKFSGLHFENIRKILLGKNTFVHSSVLFRRETALFVGGYSEDVAVKHVEDHDLWLKLGSHGTLANLEEYDIQYTLSQSQISHVHKRIQYTRDFLLVLKYAQDYPGLWRALIRSMTRLVYYGFIK